MFVVTRGGRGCDQGAAFEQRGEFAAALELRQRFPGITDNAQARKWVRTIADWKPPTAATGEADGDRLHYRCNGP